MEKLLRIESISIDAGTQPRLEINEDVVAEYAEAMAAGETFPPIVVFHDSKHYYLADGYHRLLAAKRNKMETITADVRPGTRRDAIFCAAGANGTHGLRRTQADKRHAVLLLLKDPEWSQMSDRKIAQHCHVSHTFVSSMRRAMITAMAEEIEGPDDDDVGVPRDKAEQKEVAKRAEDAGPTSPPPPSYNSAPKDKVGQPITNPQIAKVFEDAKLLQELQKQIQAIRRRLKELRGMEVCYYLHWQSADGALRDAWMALRDCQPYALASEKAKAKNETYRQVGWIPKYHWDVLPEDMR